MITIQSAMLVALGFFAAGLIGFLLAPIYGRRTARIATDRLRATMPLSSAEITADKDRLRAAYALTIHKLEQKVEKAANSAARQRVELNRRDAAISELEGEIERLESRLDEHENARRVLEQTIAERMPKVEVRLDEAKGLLLHRDREITNLTQTSKRQAEALEEATQINVQQREEIGRLKASLAARAARNRDTFVDPRFDGEIALRTEVEALRAQARDQHALISRLQETLAHVESKTVEGGAGATPDAGLQEEVVRLRKALAAAEAGRTGTAALEAEIRSLRAASEDRAAEVSRLEAALAVYAAKDADERAGKESKVSLRARVSALQAEADAHARTIQRLRAEVSAANEKLALQSAHAMEEMRRLGAGSLPAAGAPQDRGAEMADRPHRSLVERIAAPRPPQAAPFGASSSAAVRPTTPAEPSRSGGFLRALGGPSGSGDGAKSPMRGSGGDGQASAQASSSGSSANGDGAPKKSIRRSSLIERITRAEKPVA